MHTRPIPSPIPIACAAPASRAVDQRARARALRGLVAALLVTTSLPARAQPTPSDNLFQDGKALIEQGNIPEACEKFAESLALLRRGGTLLNLGLCRAKQGRYATALRLLVEARDVAARDGHADRVAVATATIDEVRPRISWISVRPAAGADVPGLTIVHDDEAVPREAWGTPQAVDPGKHTILATAPRRVRFESTVVVGTAGDRKLIEIPLLAEERPAPEPTHALPTTGPTGPEAPTSRHDAPARPSAPLAWSRPVALAAVGFGTAALAAGSVLGAKAMIDSRESKEMCPESTCPLDAYTKNQRARTEAIFTDVALPVGLVSVGVGLYLLLRPSMRSPMALPPVLPTVGPSAAGLTLRGAW